MYGQPSYLPYQGPYGAGVVYPPVQQEVQQPRPQPQAQPGQSFAWVNNEQEAKDFVVLPGNSVMLMSRNDSVFWVKATDQSGMPAPMRAFEYAERLSTPQATVSVPVAEYVTHQEYSALLERVKALEAKKCECDKEAAVNG